MPRGKKKCPSCGSFQSARVSLCSECNHEFLKNPKPAKKQIFFQERRDFIKRMLNGEKSSNYKLDMITATKVFKLFNNDIDFLSKVKPPFKLSDSIKYFLTSDGQAYLRKKKLEFEYNPKNSEKIIDHLEKVGDDLFSQKTKTLRDFLNDE